MKIEIKYINVIILVIFNSLQAYYSQRARRCRWV